MKKSKMTPRLYKAAYRFLELRSVTKYCFAPLEALSSEDAIIVKRFLTFNHQVRFF